MQMNLMQDDMVPAYHQPRIRTILHYPAAFYKCLIEEDAAEDALITLSLSLSIMFINGS